MIEENKDAKTANDDESESFVDKQPFQQDNSATGLLMPDTERIWTAEIQQDKNFSSAKDVSEAVKIVTESSNERSAAASQQQRNLEIEMNLTIKDSTPVSLGSPQFIQKRIQNNLQDDKELKRKILEAHSANNLESNTITSAKDLMQKVMY